MKNRYFLVSFNFSSDSGHGFGNSKTVTNGGYLNEKEFLDSMKKEHKFNSVIILNIIELSEQDFNEYKA